MGIYLTEGRQAVDQETEMCNMRCLLVVAMHHLRCVIRIQFVEQVSKGRSKRCILVPNRLLPAYEEIVCQGHASFGEEKYY